MRSDPSTSRCGRATPLLQLCRGPGPGDRHRPLLSRARAHEGDTVRRHARRAMMDVRDGGKKAPGSGENGAAATTTTTTRTARSAKALALLAICLVAARLASSELLDTRDLHHTSGHAHAAAVANTSIRWGEPPLAPAVLRACRHLFVPLRTECPRYFVGDRCKHCGLGHQVYELMFLVRAARKSSAVPVFEPFEPPVTGFKWLKQSITGSKPQKAEHGHYEWANELLGLPPLFEAFAAVSAPSSGPSFANAKRMKELAGMKHRRGQCGSGDKDCCGVYLTDLPCGTNCWEGGMLLAQDEFASCARVASRVLGTWVQLSPFSQQQQETVNVVVHVRVGDFGQGNGGGGRWPTYEHLVAALAPVCAAYRCAVRVIGGGSFEQAGKEETAGKLGGSVSADLMDLLHKQNLSATVTSHTDSAAEALLLMMHADVLVSSGSSFPIIASVFSDVPVLIDWRGGKGAAQHERVTTHFLSGSVLVDISGELSRANVFQLHTRLLPKLWARGFHHLSLADETKFFPNLMARQSATYKQ